MYDLYDFARSSAAYRVRIALALKQISYSRTTVDLLAGEQYEAEFRAVNPQGLVPAYTDDDIHLTQSVAIIEYLDERYPDPPLLPRQIHQRARSRQIAHIIASDIHPLNGFRVHAYLRDALRMDAKQRRSWFSHWLLDGLDALELILTADDDTRSEFAVGDTVSLADICIVPQVDLARRNGVDMDDFPRTAKIADHCLTLPAFRGAHPDNQAS